MINHKQLLMDFYLKLLAIPHGNTFRALNQPLYAKIRDCLAAELSADAEVVQAIFERMASEDGK